MLTLSRKRDERVFLTHRQTGERITVAVIRVGKSNARLGFEASQDWEIVREEVAVRQAIQRESQGPETRVQRQERCGAVPWTLDPGPSALDPV